MINEALGGQRIAVTGATGFLGTAVVERLLRTVPGCEVVILVRPGRRASAALTLGARLGRAPRVRRQCRHASDLGV